MRGIARAFVAVVAWTLVAVIGAGISTAQEEESASPSAEAEQDVEAGDWPGREHGLTQRQAEVVALITQGLTNQEIAERVFLSPNTVKTYVRSAYRKIGVERRSQAVLWGVANGFEPEALRTVDPALLIRPRPHATHSFSS